MRMHAIERLAKDDDKAILVGGWHAWGSRGGISIAGHGVDAGEML